MYSFVLSTNTIRSDNECSPSNPPLDSIQKVAYKEERPEVTIGLRVHLSEEEERKNALAMMCTKHTSWSYEREWRLIRRLDGATRVASTESGGTAHLFRFPAEAVTDVIVGARMRDDDVQRILDAVRKGDFTQARVRRATMAATTFRFDLADL